MEFSSIILWVACYSVFHIANSNRNAPDDETCSLCELYEYYRITFSFYFFKCTAPVTYRSLSAHFARSACKWGTFCAWYSLLNCGKWMQSNYIVLEYLKSNVDFIPENRFACKFAKEQSISFVRHCACRNSSMTALHMSIWNVIYSFVSINSSNVAVMELLYCSVTKWSLGECSGSPFPPALLLLSGIQNDKNFTVQCKIKPLYVTRLDDYCLKLQTMSAFIICGLRSYWSSQKKAP